MKKLQEMKKKIALYDRLRSTMHSVKLMATMELRHFPAVIENRVSLMSPVGKFNRILNFPIDHLVQGTGINTDNNLGNNKNTEEKDVNMEFAYLVIGLTVDQTGCGVHNNAMYGMCKTKISELKDSVLKFSESVSCGFIGYRAYSYFKSLYSSEIHLLWLFDMRREYLEFFLGSNMVYRLSEEWVGLLVIIFNRFYSAVNMVTSAYYMIHHLDVKDLVWSALAQSPTVRNLRKKSSEVESFLYLDDERVSAFFFLHIVALIDALNENEMAAIGVKINSLQSSVKNLDEMIVAMRIKYNKLRQELITTELLELMAYILEKGLFEEIEDELELSFSITNSFRQLFSMFLVNFGVNITHKELVDSGYSSMLYHIWYGRKTKGERMKDLELNYFKHVK